MTYIWALALYLYSLSLHSKRYAPISPVLAVAVRRSRAIRVCMRVCAGSCSKHKQCRR